MAKKAAKKKVAKKATKSPKEARRQGVALAVRSTDKKAPAKKKAPKQKLLSAEEKQFRKNHEEGKCYFMEFKGIVKIKKITHVKGAMYIQVSVDIVKANQMTGEPYKTDDMLHLHEDAILKPINVKDFLKKTNDLYKKTYL